MMTIEQVKKNGWLIFEVIAGSKAYGLDTEKSDTDIRGVFILPKEEFYGLQYVSQVANETNDIVYYELRRFIELLSKNNPNILELLAIPAQCVIYKNDIMNEIRQEMFLSKLCEKTFANYAYTQIKKAYGLEKKILNPVEEERRSALDFCYVYVGKEVLSLREFLSVNKFEQEDMGLSAIENLRDCYNLFHSDELQYAGVMKKEDSNEVCLSNIPKGEMPVGMLYFNRDGYSVYCKRHREYWEWVGKRNNERYSATMKHGKNYDAKNMMHTFRLLTMATEIAVDKKINVQRHDREFLLDIKQGKFEYDELVNKAELIKAELAELYTESDLPSEPHIKAINELLIRMRTIYYEEYS